MNIRVKISRTLLFLFFTASFLSAQNSQFRLHIQPSKEVLLGDGDEQIALTLTARDDKGCILDDVSGQVQIDISSGSLSASTVTMRKGIAEVLLTAPIMNNEGKLFQRSIELTNMLVGEMTRMLQAGEIEPDDLKDQAIELLKQAPNTSTPQTIDEKDPFVYVIAKMGEVFGKTKIKVEQAAIAKSQLGGTYKGQPFASDEEWTMTLQPEGNGFSAEIWSSSGPMDLTLKYHGETKAGMSVVYIYDKYELEQLQEFGFKGIPTAMKMLPGNAMYLVAPPVLFRKVSDLDEPVEQTEEEPEEIDHSSLIAQKNMLLADGKSQTQVVFKCVDKKGKPRSGVAVTFLTRRSGLGGTITQADKKTDSNGIARLIYQAPEIKVNSIQKLGTCKKEELIANYKNGDGESNFSFTYIGILKCADGFIKASKVGFEENYKTPVVFGSPWGEVHGNIQACFPKPNHRKAECCGVHDALIEVECEALSTMQDTVKTTTDKEGNFVIELRRKNWPTFWKDQLPTLPLLEFHKSTEHRADKFTKDIAEFNDKAFERRIRSFIYLTHKKLCQLDREQAENVSKKLHIFGLATEVFLNTRLLLKDTGAEVVSSGWAAFNGICTMVNQKYNLTKGLEKRIKKYGYHVEEKLGLRNLQIDKHRSFKSMLYRKFRSVFAKNEYYKKVNLSAGRELSIRPLFRWIDDVSDKVSEELKNLMFICAEAFSKYIGLGKFPGNPVPDLIIKPFIRSYNNDVKARFIQLIETPDENVEDWFEVKRSHLIGKSAALRDHYIQIAQWRLTVENSKAWFDFTSEIVTNGITVYTVFTGNVTAIKWIDKLKNAQTALDTLLSGANFIVEIYNYCQLKVECLAILEFPAAGSTLSADQTNATLRQSNIQNEIALVLSPLQAFPLQLVLLARNKMGLIPALLQKEPSRTSSSISSLGKIDCAKLICSNGKLDLKHTNQTIQELFSWEEWQDQHDLSLIELISHKPELMNVYFMESDNLSERLDYCLILLSAFTQESSYLYLNDEQAKAWNEEVTSLEQSVNKLLEILPQVNESMQRVEHQSETVFRQPAGDFKADKKLILIIGTAVLILLFLIFILIFFLMKRKKPALVGPHLYFGKKQTMALTLPMTQIGSIPGNHVQLTKAGAADSHARICRNEQGVMWIEVTHPNLWITVNGSRGQSFWLEREATITIGQNTLRFKPG
ncbi:MAG: hypothetical protein CSA81_13290 [Acidobacteria bacterium]|nr:MAG: hypothetical protein CSA81_13290 [Acidobacteriota bacterium]